MKQFYTCCILAVLALFAGTAQSVPAADTAENAAAQKKEAVLLDQYHMDNDLSCADCHGSGERKPVTMMKCLDCHDTGEVAEVTADLKPTNPHNNRHFGTETDCLRCHHIHRRSENFCLPCHTTYTFQVP